MKVVGNAVRLLALVVWVGGVIFFTLVAAPTLFQTLPPADAGRVVAAIFPTYYAIGAVCGGILLVEALWQFGTGDRSPATRRSLWVVGVMLACTLYAGLVVQPRAAALKQEMRDGGESAAAAREGFRSTHRMAMGLNSVVLLGGVALIALSARRPRE